MSTHKDAPAFDFYPERWLVGVAGMSDAEQLAYLRLLCHQWLLGDAGLPADLAALKRLAGRGVTHAVLAKLPEGPDGRRRNVRLETVRQEQRARIAKRREGALKTNAKRWGTDAGNESLSDRSATHQRLADHVAIESPPPTTHPKDANNAGAHEVPAQQQTPALSTVLAWAGTIGCPADKAEIWFHEHEARPLSPAGRWTDRDGNAVHRPQSALAAWWQKWRANLDQRAGGGGGGRQVRSVQLTSGAKNGF